MNNQYDTVFFGTRSASEEDGLSFAQFDRKTGTLSPLQTCPDIHRPTWVEPDHENSVLFVTTVSNDKSRGEIVSAKWDGSKQSLHIIDRAASGGIDPTYIDITSAPKTLLVANFSDAMVASIPVHADQTMEKPISICPQTGTGPHPRQSSAHAHGINITPDGKFCLAPDMGADTIFIYQYDSTAQSLTAHSICATSAGSGPRHVTFHPKANFVYVLCELTAQVIIYAWDADKGQLSPLQTHDVATSDFDGKLSVSELAITSDGKFLYIANRGQNQIVTYRVDASTGLLDEIDRVDCGGRVPWHFTLSPDERWLLVGNFGTNTVSVFSRHAETARLTLFSNDFAVNDICCVAFLAG